MKRLGEAQICEINITPLTDVFLVLLIIMMLVTPMMDFGGLPLGVPAPGDDAAKQTSNKEAITLTITESGEFLVKGTPIVPPILSATLRENIVQDSPEVVVRVHPGSNYDKLAYAIGAVYQAGITKVNILEESAESGGTGPDNEAAPASKKPKKKE